MFIVESYGLAVALCWVTMLCWGSWGNTQKLSAQTWRYELFYWDYVIGILLFSLVWGLTLGSIGEGGRGFMQDLQQVGMENFWSAFLGGVIFNASNILLSASMSLFMTACTKRRPSSSCTAANTVPVRRQLSPIFNSKSSPASGTRLAWPASVHSARLFAPRNFARATISWPV